MGEQGGLEGPRFSAKLTSISRLSSTRTSEKVAVSKPHKKAVTLYDPGLVSNRYRPDSLVSSFVSTFVSELVRVIVAPGIVAFEESTTVPVMIPFFGCANCFDSADRLPTATAMPSKEILKMVLRIEVTALIDA